MPTCAPHPCVRCRKVLLPVGAGQFCSRCERVAGRGSPAERGYDYAWARLRKAYAAAHPFCVRCADRGVLKATQIVDHIRPHCGDDALRLDPSNLQGLCRSCHATKTHTEGVGHAPPRPGR